MITLIEPTPTIAGNAGFQSGQGQIELTRVAGATVATRMHAVSPLRLLLPRSHGDAAWIFAGTYGGGLVAGDRIRLNLRAGEKTRCLLSTQASTKIYRTDGPLCQQDMEVNAGDHSLMVSAPDPVVCFAKSRYRQHQRFVLAETASLVAIDWFTSGRSGRGERWAMSGYESLTEVVLGGRCIFRDRLRLDPADGPIGGAMRMGRCDCFASLLIVGTMFQHSATTLLEYVSAQPPAGKLLFGASAIQGGVIARIAGGGVQSVGAWIRDRLTFLIDPLGGDPWARKW